MIPLLYRLRQGVRFEAGVSSAVVISEAPLNLVRINGKVRRMLELCDGTTSLGEIASGAGLAGEEEAFGLCDYFNRRSILEVVQPAPGDYLPSVSVIVPTRNGGNFIAECLESVFSQRYPEGSLEVIVIDDGSTDATRRIVGQFPCRLFTNEKSLGQSWCRNTGAAQAIGEILAFLDSDCVAGPTWLGELVLYFHWERVVAVGGFVDGYFEQRRLDRYEKVCSPLNMGRHVLHSGSGASTLYAPTCNLLVRKTAYHAVGGMETGMSVGEDVDLCWRLSQKGDYLLYVPSGVVRHKHRATLLEMVRRRADYGNSEAVLYAAHPDKRKLFPTPPLAAAGLLSLYLAVLLVSAVPVFATTGCFAADLFLKMRHLGRLRVPVKGRHVLFSLVRTYLSFFYFASFHFVRYYMLLLLGAGLVFRPFWYLCALMLLISSSVDFRTRRPRLSFPSFLFYYAVDHLSYQWGVFVGCMRAKTFGSYRLRLTKRGGRLASESP